MFLIFIYIYITITLIKILIIKMTDFSIKREKMEYDLVIVGAGPSGLSAAINFKKLCKANNKDFLFVWLKRAQKLVLTSYQVQ